MTRRDLSKQEQEDICKKINIVRRTKSESEQPEKREACPVSAPLSQTQTVKRVKTRLRIAMCWCKGVVVVGRRLRDEGATEASPLR